MSEPFCNKGCAHVYEHVAKCMEHFPYAEPSAEDFAKLDNAALFETFEGTFADYSRYSHPPIDPNSGLAEYHRPTFMEAARRLGLMKREMLKRMER